MWGRVSKSKEDGQTLWVKWAHLVGEVTASPGRTSGRTHQRVREYSHVCLQGARPCGCVRNASLSLQCWRWPCSSTRCSRCSGRSRPNSSRTRSKVSGGTGRVLGPGSWVLGPGSWVLGPGSWVLGPGSWGLGPGSWVLGAGAWGLGAGGWGLGAGGWGLGPGAWENVR